MRTTDNNCGNFEISDEHCENLQKIGNYNVCDLCSKNPDLLLFPHSFNAGYYEKSQIFSLSDKILTTNNIMGFVGRNDTQLTICSRFAQNNKDYFLHYMLQKVFAINIFNFDQTSDKENIWDFLLYLFPYYLKKAYAQGLFKAYRYEKYNDANIKGAIDIARHIRTNIPFAGKIACNTREYTCDNPVTQLIRHTIEHIKLHPLGSGVLNCDSDMRDIVSKICFITQNHYNKNERQKVISANLKPISHPYFTEYKILQKICLKILRREKITFGAEKDKIYGLLFDGAWLWEEYLNTILKNHGFTHPKNKTKEKRILLFNNSHPCYPDFYKENFVLDAKYKNLTTSIASDDMHQIISYMHVQQAELGGFIYPEKTEKSNEINIGTLRGYGGNVKLWNVNIPQTSGNFSEFCKKMKNEENKFLENLLQFPT
ncbi:MAG: McrC family protein [Prevotellaceae bacterium]|jgi:5-methylcytosine-specific restriction endonuclease McrBC regulatory subunit McrC|nr:McrC family protein [Prevotellaceae bacterium]